MPVVSVIIPFYSHKEWLDETLDSVFTQTLKDIEVVLVNDGSHEDISEIIKKYSSKIIYLTQENKGPAAARNYGMSVAKGEYIAFEDSDDVWLPTKLEKQISFMKKQNLVWSHTGFYYWWPESNKLKEVNVSREFGDIYKQRFVTVKMATPCVVVRRDYIESNNLKFPEHMRKSEDDGMWNQIAKNCPVGLIEEPLAKIRMRGSNTNRNAIDRFNLKAEEYKRIKNDNIDCPQGAIRIKYIYYIYSKLMSGKTSTLKEFFAKCLWTIPYFIERIYVKQLANNSNKDEKYISRKNNN